MCYCVLHTHNRSEHVCQHSVRLTNLIHRNIQKPVLDYAREHMYNSSCFQTVKIVSSIKSLIVVMSRKLKGAGLLTCA